MIGPFAVFAELVARSGLSPDEVRNLLPHELAAMSKLGHIRSYMSRAPCPGGGLEKVKGRDAGTGQGQKRAIVLPPIKNSPTKE